MVPNKTSQTIKNFYAKALCEISNDFAFPNVSEDVIKKDFTWLQYQ